MNEKSRGIWIRIGERGRDESLKLRRMRSKLKTINEKTDDTREGNFELKISPISMSMKRVNSIITSHIIVENTT